jgi:hypothetical protein
VEILKYEYQTTVFVRTFAILRMQRQFQIGNYLDERKVNENLGDITK